MQLLSLHDVFTPNTMAKLAHDLDVRKLIQKCVTSILLIKIKAHL